MKNVYMEKVKKAAILAILIGLLLLIIGFVFGGHSQIILDSSGFHISPKELSIYDENFEDINTIVLQVDNANITIQKGDICSVRAQYLYKQPQAKVVDGALEVSTKFGFPSFTIGFWNYKAEELAMTIPEAIKRLKIKDDNGRVTVYDITAEEILIEVDNGALKLENVVCEDLDLSADNGRIDLANVYGADSKIKSSNGKIVANSLVYENTNIKSNNGAINISGEIKGANSYIANNGSIEIEIEESNGVSYDASSKNGAVRYAGQRQGDYFIKPLDNAAIKIKARTDNGSIKINPIDS